MIPDNWRWQKVYPKGFALLIFLLSTLAIVPRAWSQMEWAEWIADGEILYESTGNINNAVFSAEEESERIWTPTLSAGRIFQMTDFTRLVLTAEGSRGLHDKFTRLDYHSLGGAATLIQKLGIGPTKPWLRARLSGARIDSRSKLRDGTLYIAKMTLGKRLTDRFDGQLSYTFDKRDSTDSPVIASSGGCCGAPSPIPKPGSVYDLEGHKGSARVNFLATEKILLSGSFSLRKGDVPSTCSPATVKTVDSIIDAVTLDDAIPGCAYRTETTTSAYSIEGSYAFLDGHGSFNVGFERSKGESGQWSYKKDTLRASLNFSY